MLVVEPGADAPEARADQLGVLDDSASVPAAAGGDRQPRLDLIDPVVPIRCRAKRPLVAECFRKTIAHISMPGAARWFCLPALQHLRS